MKNLKICIFCHKNTAIYKELDKGVFDYECKSCGRSVAIIGSEYDDVLKKQWEARYNDRTRT